MTVERTGCPAFAIVIECDTRAGRQAPRHHLLNGFLFLAEPARAGFKRRRLVTTDMTASYDPLLRRIHWATAVLFISTAGQFFCAVAIFGEAVTGWHLTAFAMIWTALALYSAASLWQARTARRQA